MLNVNDVNIFGETALFVAVENGRLKVVQKLINVKANVNYVNRLGKTALIVAAKNGYLEVVRELIKAGAKVHHVNKDGETALFVAAKNGHREVVQELINANAYVDSINHDGETALIVAAKNGHREVVRELIQAGANVHHVNKGGETALILALIENHLEVVLELIEAKANVYQISISGDTILIWAVRKGYLTIVQSLIAAEAMVFQINMIDQKAQTVVANKNGCLKIDREKFGDEYLREDRYDRISPYNERERSLVEAVKRGDKERVKQLIKNKELNVPRVGRLALITALEEGNQEVVQELINANAYVDSINHDGETALFVAVQYDRLEVVRELIKVGANVNHIPKYGNSALCVAAENGHLEVVQELIKAGAHENHILSALVVAAKYGHLKVVRELINAKANVNHVNRDGETALLAAVTNGRLEVVQELINAKANVNHVNRDGETVLIVAARRAGYCDIVKLLLPYCSETTRQNALKKLGKRLLGVQLIKNYEKELEDKKATTFGEESLPSKKEIQFPTDKKSIQEVLQRYVDGEDEVFSLLNSTNPASWENKAIWKAQLTEFSIQCLKEKKPHAEFFITLLSGIENNNQAVVEVINFVRNADDLDLSIQDFYKKSWMPLPVNGESFRELLNSQDFDRHADVIYSSLISNAQQLQICWQDEKTLEDYLWEISNKGENSDSLILLATVNPLYELLQSEIFNWRTTINHLSLAPDCQQNQSFVNTLNNLTKLYVVWAIPAPETKEALEVVLNDFRKATQYSHYSALIHSFLYNFFFNVSEEKNRLLANINDEELKGIFRKEIELYPSNQVTYINLLKLLKPEWWEAKKRGKGKQKKGEVAAGSEGMRFETEIEELVKSLPQNESLSEKEDQLGRGSEAVEEPGFCYEDERPVAFIEATRIWQDNGQMLCPITHLVMFDPVVVRNTVFERSAIVKWYETKEAECKRKNKPVNVLLPGIGIPFTLGDIDEDVSEELRDSIFAGIKYGSSAENVGSLPEDYLGIGQHSCSFFTPEVNVALRERLGKDMLLPESVDDEEIGDDGGSESEVNEPEESEPELSESEESEPDSEREIRIVYREPAM